MFCFNDVDFPTGSINDQVIAHSNGYQPRKQARVGNAYFVRLEPFDGAGGQAYSGRTQDIRFVLG